MHIIFTALDSFFKTTIGQYLLLALLVLTAFGGWKGFTCISQTINKEEPDEVQDANVPTNNEYNRLKLPE